MADSVGKSEREDGGRRRGKVMIQGGKPKKKGNEAGKENAVGGDTRNAMTIRTAGEGCSGFLGKFECTRYGWHTHIPRARMRTKNFAPQKLALVDAEGNFLSPQTGPLFSRPGRLEYLYPLVTLIFQATAQREWKSPPKHVHRAGRSVGPRTLDGRAGGTMTVHSCLSSVRGEGGGAC